MRNKAIPFLSVLATLSLVGTLSAQLRFSAETQSQSVEFGQREALYRFEFTNAGESPVTVLAVRAGCGCTATKLDQMTYAPGEGGVIEANFNLVGRTGRQTKTIAVTTDHPTHANHTLSLTAVIPEAVTMNTRGLFWRLNEDAAPKKITVTIDPQFGVKARSILIRTEQFQTELKEIESGHQYEIVVVPVATSERANASGQLMLEGPDGMPMHYGFNLRVL